jgi:hypothetical protein
LRLGTSDARFVIEGDLEFAEVKMTVLGVLSRLVCTASFCSIDCLGISESLEDGTIWLLSNVNPDGGRFCLPKEKDIDEADAPSLALSIVCKLSREIPYYKTLAPRRSRYLCGWRHSGCLSARVIASVGASA